MKYLITESQYNNAIGKFLTYQFEPHKQKKSKEHPGTIFWVKDGEIIVEIEKSGYFWVLHTIWYDIGDMFSLDYDETQSVIKQWLEKHYGLRGLTPANGLESPNAILDEQ